MIGRIIGNYRITNELAQGGMGTVYRAHHLHLPREVVVKSILLTAFSPSAQRHLKARFLREAYIQSQLDHPNIVRVYEFFALDDNYYLVMEYVPGMSLKDLIAGPGLPATSQTMHLCLQALSALEYAHNFCYVDASDTRQVGIIHRDIKPANILLDSGGRLKIADFGIVKVTGDETLTQSGFQPGTVEYMSPEQLLGLEVDERSDIYSLGVTFYEMLTGRLPFPRSATGSDWDVRKGHIEKEPPSLVEICPDIPPAVDAVFMRALKKDPNERIQSATEFMESLHECEGLLEEGVQLRRPTTGRLTKSVFALSTITDQTLIIPESNASLDSASTSTFSAQYPEEEAITIPITPARNITTRSASIPTQRPGSSEVKTNPANRKVIVSVPASPPRRKWSLAAAAAAIFLLSTAAGAYLFSGQQDSSRMLSTKIEPPIPSPSPISSPSAVTGTRVTSSPVDNSPLKQARALEQQERYPESIRKYEEYLRRNPTANDVNSISNKLVGLRQFQGLMTAANLAMEAKKFPQARQNYMEALKLRPESELAKAGLRKAESEFAINRQRRIDARQSGHWRKRQRISPIRRGDMNPMRFN